MMLLDIHLFQKSLRLIKTKALMIKINVITNNINWFTYIKNPNNYLGKKIKKLNVKVKKFKNNKIFFSLLLSDNKEIKKLNKKFRNKNSIKKFKKEFDYLWIHGFVHLFGYDHKKEKDFLKMNQIEKKYFNLLNV